MQLIDTNLITLFAFALIILPLMVSLILAWLGGITKQELVNNYGSNSQIIIGGLGVFIHELAHLSMALLFFHHIDSLKLLRLHHIKDSDTLGYVNHSYNKYNLYESLGNFFIGLAPCFLCSIVLWMVHGVFFGNQVMNFGINDNNIVIALETAENDILAPFGTFGWPLLIYIILIIMIASTGYGLSSEDIHNSMTGLPYWVLLVIFVYFLVSLTGEQFIASNLLWNLIVLLLVFAGRGLIYILITLGLIVLCKHIINF